MKQLLPYISIGTHESGLVMLIIDDYELFDFIDDYLTEEHNIFYGSKEVHVRAVDPISEA